MGLVGKAAKLYRRKARPERFFMKHPNHKLNMPTPSKINQQWAGDITYLKVSGNWSYLAVPLSPIVQKHAQKPPSKICSVSRALHASERARYEFQS